MDSLRCCECQADRRTKPTVKGNARLPAGWKRNGDTVYCAACWRNHYVLRAVTIPIAGPVGREWSDLGASLTRCWEWSTGLANWTITELAKADIVRCPSIKQMPAMPPIYLYPQARKRFPNLPSKSVAALLHTVEQRYRKNRLSVIWRSEASLQRFRYPMPFPVNNQGWKAHYGLDNIPLIKVNLGDAPFVLRLRGGNHFRRQLTAFSKIVSGEAIKGELTLYRQRASTGDHRPRLEDREPGGGQRVHYRVLAKITAWLPRDQGRGNRDGILEVRTCSDAFLKADSGTKGPWVLNADHVVRWVARHRRMLNRLAQDGKYEKQWPKRSRRQMTDYREAVTAKHRRRIDTFCHQAAGMLAAYADRIGVTEVRFNDEDKSYLSEFPWSKIHELLAIKVDQRGMKYVVSSKGAEAGEASENEAA